MYKNFALAAMAAVSTCAFAQSNWSSSMDPNNMDFWGQKKMVMDQANSSLLGGDAYNFSNMIDRCPANVSMALIHSLSNNYWQSRIIGYELAMSRYPVGTVSSYTTTVTNPDGTVTTTTTSTTDYSTTYAENMRPMRIIMETPDPRVISYQDALDVLTSNLNTTDSTVLRDWWWNKSTEGEKDVIVRFLRADSKFADQVFYPSTFPRPMGSQNNG
jgi:hypothetical protein